MFTAAAQRGYGEHAPHVGGELGEMETRAGRHRNPELKEAQAEVIAGCWAAG